MDNTKVFEMRAVFSNRRSSAPGLVPCNRGSETSSHRPLSQAVVLGERILTRVGEYQNRGYFKVVVNERATVTNRLQRLVQGDFTEPSAVLMR